MVSKLYINHILFKGHEFVGDTSITYRFKQAEFEWSLDGLFIGRRSAPLVICFDDHEIGCRARDTVLWTDLSGSWSLRFSDGIEFATGLVEEVWSLEQWLAWLPHLSSSEALYGIDILLDRKNALSPVSWKDYVELISLLDKSEYDRGIIDSLKQKWQRYELVSAIHEMTQLPPASDAVEWLKGRFQITDR